MQKCKAILRERREPVVVSVSDNKDFSLKEIRYWTKIAENIIATNEKFLSEQRAKKEALKIIRSRVNK
ncbi:hypothetical protein TetV_164 [Tetraselmis virus 1]|uniref:Uncharacterized protein n=1 Tax=Tetraselmis virus 1 TaxID=2060617 RepID=A0A2P0VMX9_9VIRU|nr:hypothetical protein QJ968_gp164 [Tetraselmis virus 1]AUF82256.1 hypothetical protein TetV_164 [Tetraselmis virus 1]